MFFAASMLSSLSRKKLDVNGLSGNRKDQKTIAEAIQKLFISIFLFTNFLFCVGYEVRKPLLQFQYSSFNLLYTGSVDSDCLGWHWWLSRLCGGEESSR